MRVENRRAFVRGIRHGIPIMLGYFAVALTLGITARSANITPGQATLSSALLNASAGGYAVFTAIGSNASYLETALLVAVANARYLLMSCALSQKLSPDTGLFHRMLLGHYITDEIFGVSMAEPGKLNPVYTYGVILMAAPGWALGTLCGAILGNVLPLRAVSALSVGLYGMFLAIILPPARKDRIVAALVAISFLLSGLLAYLLPAMSGGSRTLVLTVGISAGAAWFFPHKEEQSDEG